RLHEDAPFITGHHTTAVAGARKQALRLPCPHEIGRGRTRGLLAYFPNLERPVSGGSVLVVTNGHTERLTPWYADCRDHDAHRLRATRTCRADDAPQPLVIPPACVGGCECPLCAWGRDQAPLGSSSAGYPQGGHSRHPPPRNSRR